MLLSFIIGISCKVQQTTPENPNQSVATSPSPETVNEPKSATLVLDGLTYQVAWDDGDTFSTVHPQTNEKIRARLSGFNTLESYGPVHQWGEWTAKELYALSKSAGTFAESQVWNCTDTKNGGGYGRILVDCPDLRDAILKVGLAHPFYIDSPPSQSVLDAQNFAISKKAGMWAKGAPTLLITSLHSQDEKPDKDAYNRVCEIKTGLCSVQTHQNTYSTCEKVCIEDSCMLYVPYLQRYGQQRASCLR